MIEIGKTKGTRCLGRRTAGWCAVFLWSLAGCALGPNFVRPSAPTVQRYTHEAGPGTPPPADGSVQSFQEGAKVPGDWWRLFKSSELDGLMNEAFANNQDLQGSQASLRQSQASLQAGFGVFYPQFDADFGTTREKFSPIRFGSTAPASIFNLYTLSATVGYTLDLFGGKRRALEDQ